MNITDLTPQHLRRAASIKEKLDTLNRELRSLLDGSPSNGDLQRSRDREALAGILEVTRLTQSREIQGLDNRSGKFSSAAELRQCCWRQGAKTQLTKESFYSWSRSHYRNGYATTTDGLI
jgi:hypothetical protein